MVAGNPLRDLWSRIRGLGRVVEDELYDFTEEDAEREDEPRGRNTLVALLNGFLTMWKATNANVAERTLGLRMKMGKVADLVDNQRTAGTPCRRPA